MSEEKLVCDDWRCGWYGYKPLKAENPFIAGEPIYGCPDCKDIGTLVRACDEEGCKNFVTCGTPTDKGYRSTCGKHAPR